MLDVKPGSLRSRRWVARAPRIALMVTCAALAAAGLHSALVAPAAPTSAARLPGTAQDTTAQEAFAEAFARVYLSWDRNAAARLTRLRRYSQRLADDLRSELGTSPTGEQDVTWTAVLRDEPAGRERRITILADTSNGQTALAVTVRERDGVLAVDGYPAIVGVPPASDGDADEPAREPIDDGELEAMATRALRNFLACRGDALTADLLPGAVAVLPASPMRVASAPELTWAQRGRSVDVVVRVRLASGGELNLAYELGVARQAGRWFVRWIEDQPMGGM